MRKRVAFTALLLIAAACGVAVTSLRTGPGTDYAATSYLFVALSIIGALDVWLPRGDYSDMGGALVFASGLLIGPLPGIAVVVGSRILVWATRKPRDEMWQVVDDVARRVAQMSWSLAFFWVVGGVTPISAGGDGYLFIRVLAAAVLFFALELVVSQLGSAIRLETPFAPLLAGNVRMQGWMETAQMSVAVLAVITYGSMQALGIVIVTGLLLVMRQSFALLVEVRHAFRSTIEALARSIEAHDSRRRGHAERVAALSTEAGRIMGLSGKHLEALTYAALFHDVGRLDADTAGERSSASVLENVGFLSASVPILQIIDDSGETETSEHEEHLVAAYIVARMSEHDDRAQGLQASDDTRAAGAIGARLYAATRVSVDRAINRAQQRANRGRLRAAPSLLGGTLW